MNDPKSDSTEPGTTNLRAAYPMLFVADVAKSVEFYKTKLEFKVDYVYGEPPFYGMITRDGASLHLRHVGTHPMHHTEQDLLSASIPVEGAKALFLEYKDNGVEFHQPLKLQPWVATDFILRDPDGNLLGFSSTGFARPACAAPDVVEHRHPQEPPVISAGQPGRLQALREVRLS